MKNLFIVLMIAVGLTAAFNNCSKVGFSEATPAASGAGSSSSLSVDSGSQPSVSDAELLAALPPEEQDKYRPISDLEKYPELVNIYQCPGGTGILLCHFPSSLDAEHTLCVGSVNAALTHSGHELTVDPSGNVQGDYLGPCKKLPAQ